MPSWRRSSSSVRRNVASGAVQWILPTCCFEVGQRRLDAAARGEFLLGTAHEFVLIDVIDVDAELGHPLRGIDDRGVDAERPSADQGVRQPAQTTGRGDGAHARDQRAVHGRILEVAERLGEADACLIERPGVGQHADQPRELRVDVREHRDRLRAELRRHARVLRPRPHREVEDDRIDIGRGHRLAVAHGDVVAPDDLVAEHDLVAVGAQLAGQRVAELPLHRSERLAEEVAAVPEVEEADAERAGLQMVRAWSGVGIRDSGFGSRDSGLGSRTLSDAAAARTQSV